MKKPEPVRIATLLAVIGKEASKVYEVFTWGSVDRNKIANVLMKFHEYCDPKHNVIYDRFLFNSRKQEAGEGISRFVTELRHLKSTCEFGDKEDKLIRDRIVLSVKDHKIRAKPLREKNLTLESAQEIVCTSEVTSSQVQEITSFAEQSAHPFTRRENLTTPSSRKENRPNVRQQRPEPRLIKFLCLNVTTVVVNMAHSERNTAMLMGKPAVVVESRITSHRNVKAKINGHELMLVSVNLR